jgi:hypothetical protein
MLGKIKFTMAHHGLERRFENPTYIGNETKNATRVAHKSKGE